LEEAYWKTEIVDAYCRILILSRQLGGISYLNEQKSRELLDLKKKLGFDDPRFHVDNCDLCGNTAFRDGYRENLPKPSAFEAPPVYPGYLKPAAASAPASAAIQPVGTIPAGVDMESLVRAITDQVMASLGQR
jgi:L-fuculose-phosphate aldolase